MKKIIFAALMFVGLTAMAQQPTSNLQQNPSPVPIYTPNSYPTQNYTMTGAYTNYLYDTAKTPASDTLRISFTGAATEDKVIQVTHNLILLFDTVGDTIRYATQYNNFTWYKKQPFQYTHNLDKINLIFYSTSTTNKFKVTVPWYNAGLAGDTIHVPVKGTGTGGALVKVQWLYQKAAPIWTPYSTW